MELDLKLSMTSFIDQDQDEDVVSWNEMIAGFYQLERGNEVIQLIQQV